MADTPFLMYKGKPLVRCGDTIYYGSMADPFVIRMLVQSKQPNGELEVADKVTVQLLNTEVRLGSRRSVIKTSEKPSLGLAMDIGVVWLQKALREAAKNA